MTNAVKLEEWAQQVVAASPALDSEGKRIAVQAYHLLAHGEPVSPAEIAEAAGVPRERVEERLRSWPLVLWDDQDRVVGFFGLQVHHIEPTHSIEVEGRTVYGWCAWDTLFITEILGNETHVESTDPHSGASIRLTVTPEGVTEVQPPEAVVSLLLPDGGLGADAIQRFCHRIYFFASPQSAQQWMADRPGMFAVTVAEAFQLGQLTNRLRLGAPMDQIGSNNTTS
ncbi:MAG: organomercurial lyase [Acidimicrobiia bacterium]